MVEIDRLLLGLALSFGAQEINLNDIRNSLEHSLLIKNKIRFKNGFFYLRGRDNILSKRHERYVVAKR